MSTEKKELLALMQSCQKVGPEVSLSSRSLALVPFAAGMIDSTAESGSISRAKWALLMLHNPILLLLV
jgi:hypothetical protein